MNGFSPRGRRISRSARRAALAAFVLVIVLPVSVAGAGVLEDQLKKTRSEAGDVEQQLVRVDRRQQQLVRQVSTLNDRISELDVPINRLSLELDSLEVQIENRENRIAELKRDYVEQKREIARLNLELTAARDLLQARVLEAYKQGDAGWIEQLAGSGTLSELIDRQEALGQVVGLDERVIGRISETERKVRLKRARNHETRRRIRDDIAELESDRSRLDANRAELEQRRAEIAAVKAERDATIQALADREQELGQKLDDLESDAAKLQEAIENGVTDYSGLPGIAPSGLMWPVSGPVVSGFGPRWGRMHEGIDIAIGAGNPIYAAAAGVVTYAGWMGGYGNVVIVQHAGVLSTTYAHQSQIATAVGQTVGQGQLLGYVGCTGHCYGDHVHFETRENGVAVDPMRYL